ncbi:MAG: transposase [Gemmatimonadetes bacterium]|nr:transposase [Gemmatimonadota bacterium]
MRTSKFTDEQIVAALRQAEAGTPAVDICRKLGVTETTFYRWKRRFGDLGVTEVREPAAARRESAVEVAGGGVVARQDDSARGAQAKVVTPTAKRELVAWAAEAYQLSTRRACHATGWHARS